MTLEFTDFRRYQSTIMVVVVVVVIIYNNIIIIIKGANINRIIESFTRLTKTLWSMK